MPSPHRLAAGFVAVVLAGCAGAGATGRATTTAPATTSSTATTSVSGNLPALPDGWVADEVQVPTNLGTVWGTWTHPDDTGRLVPAALIIGGSGPTDRDGNSAGARLEVDNLAALANWLAADGVATLRTDKPGSGKTGRGNLTPATAAAVTVDDFLTMNAELLTFTANQPGVAGDHLAVVGHSEGGLFALLLGAGRHGAATGAPTVQAIAGLEPQSSRILDIITTQVTAQVQQAQTSGALPDEQATAMLDQLAAAVAAVRAGTAPPADLPPALAALFPATALTYLRTEDALDPQQVASTLPTGLPVLLSCSDADIQIACADVEQLAGAARAAGAGVTFSHLTDVAHTLKVDPSRTGEHYGDDLPFSPILQQAVTTWATTFATN